jgi:hypothetical protein
MKMFERLGKSSEQLRLPGHLEVLGALLKGNEYAENLLRMGRDDDAIKQLRMMALPAAKALQKHKEAFNPLVNLTRLLIQTRQLDLAKGVVSSLQEVARLAGADAVTVAQHLARTVEGASQNPPTEVGREASTVSPVYACQRCGLLNCFLTEPCLNCGFLTKDDDAVRLGMLLSSAYLQITYLPALGHEISQGARPEVLLPDIKAHIANVPLEQAKSLAAVVAQKNYKSRRYPTVPSLSTCPTCTKSVRLSSDETCHECTRPLQLPAIQRFIIATARTVRSIQHMLAPQDSPAFGRLLCLLVAFEARAFEEGRPPSRDERLDALSTMQALKYLDTRDGAMRVIFTSNGIEIGANQNCKTHQFSQVDLMSLFGEWIALDKHLREGVALR